MAESGKVLETSVGPNRDQEIPVRLIKTELSCPEDVQTLQLVGSIDHNPVDGTQVLVLKIGESWKLAIPLNDGIEPGAEKGEKWLYSQDEDGLVKATFRLKNDGTIEINGAADTAVGFTELKAGFDQLKTEVDANHTALLTTVAAMVTLFNAPAAPMVSAPGAVASYVKVSLTATVDGSEKGNVKLP